MSLPLLYSEVKFLGRDLGSDFNNALGANDFELALRDFSSLNDVNKFKDNFTDLNWFELSAPTIYTKKLSYFLNYLSHICLLKLFRNGDSAEDLERYFTDQVLSYLTRRSSSASIELGEIYKYWKILFIFLESYVKSSKKYKYHNSNSSIYFTTTGGLYKIDIPLLCWDRIDSVDCFVNISYHSKKPNWFTVPSLYKIYSYFQGHNITVQNLKIFWFDLENSNTTPIQETIPLTKNVAELVSRYSCVAPFPFENIFSKDNPKYYKITPLSTLL